MEKSNLTEKDFACFVSVTMKNVFSQFLPGHVGFLEWYKTHTYHNRPVEY